MLEYNDKINMNKNGESMDIGIVENIDRNDSGEERRDDDYFISDHNFEDDQMNGYDLDSGLRNERENRHDDQLIVGGQLLINILIINNIHFLIIHYLIR